MRETRFLRVAVVAVAAMIGLGACGESGEGDAASRDLARNANAGSRDRPSTNSQSPREGSKAAAPGVPTSRHGDNSIQTWGLEASAARRKRASALVQEHLDARAARRWGKVCSLLSARRQREYDRMAGGAGCAKGMGSFFAEAPAAALAEEAQVEVLSFRAGRGHGFLIYRRLNDRIYATALERRGSGWAVLSVTPTPLY